MTIRLLLAAALLGGCAPRTVFVRVSDAESGAPLFGARVVTDRSDVIATTDSSGSCPYPEGPVKGANVSAGKPGYLGAVQPAPAGRRRADTLLFEVGLYVDLPRTVQCEVVDSVTGSPFLGAVVRTAGGDSTATDRLDGSWWFARFPAGPTALVAEAEGCAPETLPVLARGGETTEIQFRLADTLNTGLVQGTVADSATGAPLAGVRLSIERTRLAARTEANGSFLIARVPAGDRVIVCELRGYRRKRIRLPVVRGWSMVVDPRLAPSR